jgi:hypothetical protein
MSHCDRCPAVAVWSIQNIEGPGMQPITRWFACGRHINAVLRDGQWELDAVQIMHLQGSEAIPQPLGIPAGVLTGLVETNARLLAREHRGAADGDDTP